MLQHISAKDKEIRFNRKVEVIIESKELNEYHCSTKECYKEEDSNLSSIKLDSLFAEKDRLKFRFRHSLF